MHASHSLKTSRAAAKLYRASGEFQISSAVKQRFAKHDLDRYEKEQLILVDKNDNEIGKANIVECHMTNYVEQRKTSHRAFSVVLFDTKFNMLLQRRAKTKPIFPLYWANACCSHPQKLIPGEDETTGGIGPKRAASRRLAQELGISLAPEAFKLQGIFHYEAKYDNTFSEREMDYLVAAKVSNPGQHVVLNPKEVDTCLWVSRLDFVDCMADLKKNGGGIAPWFEHIVSMGLVDWWQRFEESGIIDEPYGGRRPPIFNTIDPKRL